MLIVSVSTKQEVVYAGLAFVFMAYLMDQTNVIERLVNILNAFLGKLPGGSGYVATIGCAISVWYQVLLLQVQLQ